MHALVYDGPGQKSWQEVPDPVLMLEAYDVFSRPGETGALKVVLTRGES